MSTGSASIPLLKAAPEADQVAERLAGGPWAGLELCLMARDVADDAAADRAADVVRRAIDASGSEIAVTAEAPVAWPSGAFVRVDRLDREARDGMARSARFAAAIGSPVLTIHLFIPQTPEELRASGGVDEPAVEAFLRCFAQVCGEHGVIPLIENVPPVLRMRTGGVYLTPIGGHWRDLLSWRARVPALGFTLDTSHAALFHTFAGAYPSLWGLEGEEGLELGRYVEELGPAGEVAHVSNAAGVLGEGLPYDEGELDLDPVVARIGELFGYVVAEINEPDHARSPSMKAGYRSVARALPTPAGPWRRPPRRIPGERFDWQLVTRRRDPVPAVLDLEEELSDRRVLVTGGAGSIGRSLTTLLEAFRPRLITVLDSHEAALTADRRARGAANLARFEHVLCDVRDRRRLEAEFARAAPDVVVHLAAYKHVDWAERYPEEFAATNLDGSWNVLRCAEAAGTGTVVVASTDKAARHASQYGRTKRLMEGLAGVAAQRSGARRAAVRLVNVLGSGGSASELFLRQARAGVPLTVTDTGMLRYWITMAHAAALVGQAILPGPQLMTAAEPAMLTVGELAARIWRGAGGGAEPDFHVMGVRPGETMDEVLIGAGERLGGEVWSGVAEIAAAPAAGDGAWRADPASLAALVEDAERQDGGDERRAVWLRALGPAPVATP
jgi:nucleoside-diphosphate-sugar epimerase/sugar phosphate isomerase/epimerase